MKVKTRNGYEFQVDPEDEALAKEKGWHGITIAPKKANGEYGKSISYISRSGIINNSNRDRRQYLHRVILNLSQGSECDHINGDGLDNRRANLRIVTHSQNMANMGQNSKNKSGYKGVHWSTRDNKWRVQPKINGKAKYVGIFDDAKEAALAYNKAMTELFGEYARLNEIK